MKSVDKNNHAKLLERLRLDPRFIELQDKAIADPDNRKLYIKEARRIFNLSPSWGQFLDWYLSHPQLKLPMTGASFQPYKDPVSGREYYMIPVDPESTKENVARAYDIIKDRYRENGMSINLRQIDITKTAIGITAFRLKEDGLSNAEILTKLEDKFPDEPITKEDIPLLVRAGKEKSMS